LSDEIEEFEAFDDYPSTDEFSFFEFRGFEFEILDQTQNEIRVTGGLKPDGQHECFSYQLKSLTDLYVEENKESSFDRLYGDLEDLWTLDLEDILESGVLDKRVILNYLEKLSLNPEMNLDPNYFWAIKMRFNLSCLISIFPFTKSDVKRAYSTFFKNVKKWGLFE
jgi:hypothetical protein